MTPLMKQYWTVKDAHPDKVVFFRMGDFFELFHQDAETVAPLLGLTLTQRNKKSGDNTAMCGMPHHSVAEKINKLLGFGYKVVICDQVEDPKEAKGLVKREVTRILSPGVVYDPESLPQDQSNYICSFNRETLSFLDTSSGEGLFYKPSNEKEVENLLETLSPVELVISKELKKSLEKKGIAKISVDNVLREIWGVSAWNDKKPILISVPEESSKYQFADLDLGIDTNRILVNYFIEMQGVEAQHIMTPFKKGVLHSHMSVPATTLKHLEVFHTYSGDAEGSLFAIINKTKTACGARKLKDRLRFPSRSTDEMNEQWAAIAEWKVHPGDLREVRERLFRVGDLSRRVGKISHPNSTPRDLWSLSQSLEAAYEIKNNLAVSEDILIAIHEVLDELYKALDMEVAQTPKNGGYIRLGYSAELDELSEWAQSGQSKILELELREREKTQIPTLKVRYNNVFGYYIEVTHTHKNKVPQDRYIRKQTLTSAERYITEELQEIESKVLSALAKKQELEKRLFLEVRQQVLTQARKLLLLSEAVAQLDVTTSLAWLALENNYTQPRIGSKIILESCRHPVVEKLVDDFKPNTIELQQGECLLLTGPNMAGKSTIMRQVALNILLAQAGSFVPADRAEFIPVDGLYTRIGASDNLSAGQSTFMVEMSETAQIIESATPQSLVLIDEVGRGTSTYDGMSLAHAILEELVQKNGCFLLFATHYHELTSLSEKDSRIKNFHMLIRTQNGEFEFLHQLASGPANKSYGIEVARLAGVHKSVVMRAFEYLQDFENQPKPSLKREQLELFAEPSKDSRQEMLEQLMQKLSQFDVNQRTPLEASLTISNWQQQLQNITQ